MRTKEDYILTYLLRSKKLTFNPKLVEKILNGFAYNPELSYDLVDVSSGRTYSMWEGTKPKEEPLKIEKRNPILLDKRKLLNIPTGYEENKQTIPVLQRFDSLGYDKDLTLNNEFLTRQLPTTTFSDKFFFSIDLGR